jgi:hypothetical protein
MLDTWLSPQSTPAEIFGAYVLVEGANKIETFSDKLPAISGVSELFSYKRAVGPVKRMQAAQNNN